MQRYEKKNNHMLREILQTRSIRTERVMAQNHI